MGLEVFMFVYVVFVTPEIQKNDIQVITII